MGRLRGGHQRRTVYGHRHKIHPPVGRTLGSQQSDDRQSIGKYWYGGRPPVLQTGLLSVHPGGGGLYPNAFRGNYGKNSSNLSPLQAQSTVSWPTLSFLSKKTISISSRVLHRELSKDRFIPHISFLQSCPKTLTNKSQQPDMYHMPGCSFSIKGFWIICGFPSLSSPSQ